MPEEAWRRFQNWELERAVLGCMILSPEARTWCLGNLVEVDFSNPSYAALFATLRGMEDQREHVDPVSVSTRLISTGLLDDLGGPVALASIVEAPPFAGAYRKYAKDLQGLSGSRKLLDLAAQTFAAAAEPGSDTREITARVHEQLLELTQEVSTADFLSGDKLAAAMYAHIDNVSEGGKAKWGLPELDEMFRGLVGGRIYYVAAPTGGGKSALAQLAAYTTASRHNLPVAVYTLEMGAGEYSLRWAAWAAGLPFKDVEGMPSQMSTDSAIDRAIQKVASLPLRVYDGRTPNVRELCARMRAMHQRDPVGLIVVDYLQLLEPTGNAQRPDLVIAEMSRGLKNLARELNVPVLACVQFNRSAAVEGDYELHHLKGGSSLEQDADVVLGITIDRPDEDEKQLRRPDDPIPARIRTLKNRWGPCDVFYVDFIGPKMRFVSRARDR